MSWTRDAFAYLLYMALRVSGLHMDDTTAYFLLSWSFFCLADSFLSFVGWK